MEKTNSIYDIFVKCDIDFFSGVPDSMLSDFSKELQKNSKKITHVIAPNEGSAIAAAIGYHAVTNKIPLIYMQNSGLGNAINPLVSLASKKVWSVPMLLLIGWRGNYGLHDEPQHKQQGKITKAFLDLMRIDYELFDEHNAYKIIKKLMVNIKKKKAPAAILFKKKYSSPCKNLKMIFKETQSSMTRLDAIETILDFLNPNDILIATTGKTSRELYYLQKNKKITHSDLFVIGGMGHASSIALGILRKCKNKRVFLLDGDGALLMHMGVMSLLGKEKGNSFIHVLLNNKVHDSVGGQPTAIVNINLKKLVYAFNYKYYKKINSSKALSKYLNSFQPKNMSYFLDLNIKLGSLSSLPRPKEIPLKNFQLFKNKIGFK